MPRFQGPSAATTNRVEFAASISLDLLNAMYFTSLAGTCEGVDDWPVQVRRDMRPELLQELDFLFYKFLTSVCSVKNQEIINLHSCLEGNQQHRIDIVL